MPRYERPLNLNGIRKYLTIDRDEKDTKNYQGIPHPTVSVCTYNVLSEELRVRDLSIYEDRWQHIKTDWQGRWPRIVEQLMCTRADVYCLQEVEKQYFESHFKPLFEFGNYECHFTLRGPDLNDGCLLAYNKTKFSKCAFDAVTYNYNVLGFNRDNVGQVIWLQENSISQRMILVANTHVCEDSREYNVKIGQNILLLATIDKFYIMASAFKNFSGVILCGNLGFAPYSPLYNFICNGILDFTEHDIKNVANHHTRPLWCTKYRIQPEVRIYYRACSFLEPSVYGKTMEVEQISHPRRFLSAYGYKNERGGPKVTCFNQWPGSAQDYIFYSGGWAGLDGNVVCEKRILLHRILSIPTNYQLDKACGLMPNVQTGSDHLALWAEFLLI